MGREIAIAVRKYFIRIDNTVSKCKVCGNNVKRSCGNGWNLKRHLQRHHPDVVDKDAELQSMTRIVANRRSSNVIHYKNAFSKEKIPLISNYGSMMEGYSAIYSETGQENPIICINIPNETPAIAENQQNQINPHINTPIGLSQESDILHKTFRAESNELNICLVKTIVKNYLSVQIVESLHFKNFVENLNKFYELPSAETVSNVLIPQIYNSTKEDVRNNLKDATACAISVDTWTSLSNVTYMSVSAHYINSQIQLKSSLLDCFKYEGHGDMEESSPESLADELQRVILEWDIDWKIVAIVSDNDPNVVAIVEMSGSEHVPCFSHSINHIVIVGLEEVKHLLLKVKLLVDFFKGSPQANEKLRSMQLEFGENHFDLKQNEERRWNTTYDMLCRILEVKDSLVNTIAIHYPHLENLTPGDLCLIGEICELLKMFKDVNEEICKEGEVTVSKIILLTQALLKYCTKFLSRKGISEAVQGVGKRLLKALKNKFEKIEENQIIAEATFLDPRFKRYGFVNKEHFDRIKETVISKANDEVSPNNKQSPGIVKVVMGSEDNSCSMWDDFDNSVSDVVQNVSATAAGSIEVDKYLAEPLLVRHGNPLSWWLEKREDYPRLFKIATGRLCIVGISTQMFSNAGQTNLDRRNCLSGDEVSKILFLNGNL